MKNQPENRELQGLGKKIVQPVIAEPEWKAIQGKPHHYINASGQKKFAPPVPDCPQHPTAIDVYLEAISKRVDDLLNGASFDEAEQP